MIFLYRLCLSVYIILLARSCSVLFVPHTNIISVSFPFCVSSRFQICTRTAKLVVWIMSWGFSEEDCVSRPSWSSWWWRCYFCLVWPTSWTLGSSKMKNGTWRWAISPAYRDRDTVYDFTSMRHSKAIRWPLGNRKHTQLCWNWRSECRVVV